MKQSHILDDIRQIVGSIDIDADGGLRFNGRPYPGHERPGADPEAQLFHNLNNLLYSACYTRGGEALFGENRTATKALF